MARCSGCSRRKFPWRLEHGLCAKCIDKAKREKEEEEEAERKRLEDQQERERLLRLHFEESKVPRLDDRLELISKRLDQENLGHTDCPSKKDDMDYLTF